jgi:hypothetical protein
MSALALCIMLPSSGHHIARIAEIAKESKLNSSIPAIFGSVGDFGNG